MNADEIDAAIAALPDRRTEAVRAVRRECSERLRGAPAADVLALTLELVARRRWVAYELLYTHRGGIEALDIATVERLGEGIADWGATDAFSRYISGPAWRRRRIADADVHRWARSEDRWWRRAALVSTIGLNLRAAGGTGDPERTFAVCRRLAADRDDMVVKALSWAVREVIVHDPAAVRAFMAEQGDALAARVRREVRAKLGDA